MYTTTEIKCLTCRESFTWTAGEQADYAGRGWAKPKRCEKCREVLRQNRERDRRDSFVDERAAADAVNPFEDYDARRGRR